MPLSVSEPVTLYNNKRFYSAFPSVAVMPSGDFVLAFRRAPDHRWLLGEMAEEDFNCVDHVHFRSHIAFMRFTADTVPYGEPDILPVHAEAGDQDGNLYRSSSGRLFQYSFRWYPITIEVKDKLVEKSIDVLSTEHLGAGYIFHSSYIRYSDDEGKSWSTPFDTPADPLVESRPWSEITGSGAFKGRMVECENGDLLLAGYHWSIPKLGGNVTRFFRSSDQGETWAYQPHIISMGSVQLQEPTLVKWPEGKITALHRTANNDDKLVVAVSEDDGHTFSAPETTDITGHPYDALVLPDGRLFLVYGYRHDPMGVRARVIEDGQPFAEAEEIIIRDNSPSRDVGYPSAAMMTDGRILVTYYITDPKGIRCIEASILTLE